MSSSVLGRQEQLPGGSGAIVAAVDGDLVQREVGEGDVLPHDWLFPKVGDTDKGGRCACHREGPEVKVVEARIAATRLLVIPIVNDV